MFGFGKKKFIDGFDNRQIYVTTKYSGFSGSWLVKIEGPGVHKEMGGVTFEGDDPMKPTVHPFAVDFFLWDKKLDPEGSQAEIFHKNLVRQLAKEECNANFRDKMIKKANSVSAELQKLLDFEGKG